MKLFPPEPNLNLYDEGFNQNDILQRIQVGEALSNLIDRIDGPLVIALDGKWGTGKTYFLKRWVGAHKLENGGAATTVYFDAFAHDYHTDPLPALISALADRIPKEKEDQIEKAKQVAFKLAKPLARIALSVASFGANEALNDLGDAVTEAVRVEASDALQNYWDKEEARFSAMAEFKEAIAKLASHEENDREGASVVIVIDELGVQSRHLVDRIDNESAWL